MNKLTNYFTNSKQILRLGGLLACLVLPLAVTSMVTAQNTTGDPWKMLVLVYRNTDADYVDIDGVTKHLTATMPPDQVTNMVNTFLNLPHRAMVYDYSDQLGELEAHVEVIDTPLTTLDSAGANGYWPSPANTAKELDQYGPPGLYDSVLVFWQPSNPDTGQSVPINAFGLGYWGGNAANGMTYAAIINIDWVFASDPCNGEVFLHEWLHGVTSFYMSLGFLFPPNDLHGAEQAGYSTDSHGCWTQWYRDYMRGLVYENGQPTALVPATWHSGSITTHDIQGWRAEFYNNETLDDLPVVVRDDADVNFDWGTGSPHPLIQADHFSSRWTKDVNFEGGHYLFQLYRDDGLRIYIDDSPVFNEWQDGSGWQYTDIAVGAGLHTVRIEHYEADGPAGVKVAWALLPGTPEVENNNRPGRANPIIAAAHGFIQTDGDIDYYSFSGQAGQSITATIAAQSTGSSLDSSLILFDSDGTTVLAGNDDYNGYDSQVSSTLPHDGQYYLAVRDIENNGGPSYWYSLNLELGPVTGGSLPYFLSLANNKKIGDIRATNADILRYDKATNTWTMVYDGSGHGTRKISDFDVMDDGSLLLVFSGNRRIAGLGIATPFDVVRFTPDNPNVYPLGAGTYSWFFQGKPQGLTRSSEKIDAINLTGDRLLLSTSGTATVPLASGGELRSADEDVMAFNMSTGQWEGELVIDGSKIPGMAAEDVNSISNDPASDDYLITIRGGFRLDGVKGNGRSIVRLTPNGGPTVYTPSLVDWLAPGEKFPSNLEGLSVEESH